MCGEPFEYIVCRLCGEINDHSGIAQGNLCKKCNSRLTARTKNERHRKMIQKREDRFNAWLAKVAKVPKNYPTLTEEQWLEACKFFDGCARCSSEDIDTRGFFIVAKLGGRYCDWNVIPLCERCAKTWNKTKSVFVTALYRDNKNKNTEYRDQLEKIVEYLEVKLDAAIQYDSDAAGTTKRPE